jgi:thioredoxin-like negative regulator of GroEL
MKLLGTQTDFEELWFDRSTTKRWIIYFTASWCKPCKNLDLEVIQAAADAKGLPIFLCDETVNNYTSGYCGVRGFPTFIAFAPKTIQSQCNSNNTNTVIEWLHTL